MLKIHYIVLKDSFHRNIAQFHHSLLLLLSQTCLAFFFIQVVLTKLNHYKPAFLVKDNSEVKVTNIL